MMKKNFLPMVILFFPFFMAGCSDCDQWELLHPDDQKPNFKIGAIYFLNPTHGYNEGNYYYLKEDAISPTLLIDFTTEGKSISSRCNRADSILNPTSIALYDGYDFYDPQLHLRKPTYSIEGQYFKYISNEGKGYYKICSDSFTLEWPIPAMYLPDQNLGAEIPLTVGLLKTETTPFPLCYSKWDTKTIFIVPEIGSANSDDGTIETGEQTGEDDTSLGDASGKEGQDVGTGGNQTSGDQSGEDDIEQEAQSSTEESGSPLPPDLDNQEQQHPSEESDTESGDTGDEQTQSTGNETSCMYSGVPNVVGLSLDDAGDLLTEQGYGFTWEDKYLGEQNKGLVVQQVPIAGGCFDPQFTILMLTRNRGTEPKPESACSWSNKIIGYWPRGTTPGPSLNSFDFSRNGNFSGEYYLRGEANNDLPGGYSRLGPFTYSGTYRCISNDRIEIISNAGTVVASVRFEIHSGTEFLVLIVHENSITADIGMEMFYAKLGSDTSSASTLNTPADLPAYSPISGCASSKIHLGDKVILENGTSWVTMRSYPDTQPSDNRIGKILPGDSATVIDGPECSYGWILWKVERRSDGLYGWVPESNGKEFWLVPVD